MLHTIKTPDPFFNLLFLEYSEMIINNFPCLWFNSEKKQFEESILYMNSRSFLVNPRDIEQPVRKFSYSDNFTMKTYSFEELIHYYQTIEKEASKKNYVNNNKKRTTGNQYLNSNIYNHAASLSDKKFSLSSISSTIPLCSFDFKLNNLNKWLNKFVFDSEIKISQNYNKNSNNSNINSIFNSKGIDLGIKKKNDDQEINLNELINLLLQVNYRSSYFISLVMGLIEAFPLLNVNYNNTYNLNNIGNIIQLIQNGQGEANTEVQVTPSKYYYDYFSSLQKSNNIQLLLNSNINQNSINQNSGNLLSSKIKIKDNNNNKEKDKEEKDKDKDKEFHPNNYLANSMSSYKYFFCLFKANKCTKINRIPCVTYDIMLDPQLQFVILMLSLGDLNMYFEDKILAESIYSSSYDDNEILNRMVYKKVKDTLDYLTIPRDIFSLNFTVTNNINYKLISKVTRILPEGNQIGVLVITKSNLLQFYSSVNRYKDKTPCKSFHLREIKGIVIYRYLYKNKALNIFRYKATRSFIIDFESVTEMETAKNILFKECTNLDSTFTDIPYHTKLWVNGIMSNYDYLLYLNMMSSRSFLEPSQYPVFPWIIANYDDNDEFILSDSYKYCRDLSKPIGALNKEKLERMKTINDMNYLYPNHYSTPFNVSYYLIRSHPHYSLRLNSGKHDKSDRIFYSLKESWDIINSSSTNFVYEMTPE